MCKKNRNIINNNKNFINKKILKIKFILGKINIIDIISNIIT